MKDLTHYFQLPPKEKDNRDQRENIEMMIDKCGENLQRKSYKKHTKSKSGGDKDSHFLSSDTVCSAKEQKSKQSSSKTIESERKNTVIFEDKNTSQDIDLSLKGNIENEPKNSDNESTLPISSFKTSRCKKKISLSSNKNKRPDDSKEKKAEVRDENHDKKISPKKISKNGISAEASIKRKSKRKLNLSLQECDLSLQKSTECDSSLKSKSVANNESKSSKKTCKDDSLKTPPLLDDNRNAFYVLMSSRAWKSPHDDVNKSGNESSSLEKKKEKFDGSSPLQSAEVKENKRKRKKKLENMVEEKVSKKQKYTGVLSKEETTNSNKTRRRILIVPESDSDDDNIVLESKNSAEDIHGDIDLRRRKESINPIFHENISVKDQERTEKKLSRNKKTLQNKLQNSVNSETHQEMAMEELDDDSSKIKEKPAKKKLKIDFSNCYVNRSNDKEVVKSKRKLIIESSDSDTEINVKKEVIRKKNKLGNKKSESGKILEQKIENNKTQVTKSSHTIDTNTENSVNQENRNLKLKTNLNHTSTDFDSESESHLITPDRKKRIKKVLKGSSVNSDVMLSKDKNSENLSENTSDTKKRNSLFSYFNKVSKDEVVSRSEKIQVKAQIHSPPTSPSSKRRSSTVSKDNKEQRRHSSRHKVSDKEDQIIVLESLNLDEIPSPQAGMKTPKGKRGDCWLSTPPSSNWKMRVKLRESSVEPASDSDDDENKSDHIFTPKKRKKWANSSTSVQQNAARKVLHKAKTMVAQRRSLDNDSPTKAVKFEEEESDVVICSSSEKSKSDANIKLAPLFVRKAPKPKLDASIVEARKNFLKSGVPEPVKKFVDLQRSMEEQNQFTFPSIAHVQQKDRNASVWDLPVVKIPVCYENTVSPTLDSVDKLQTITLGMFTNCSNTSFEPLSIVKPSIPEPVKYYQKLLHLLKMESPDFPIYRNFRRLRLKNNHVNSQKHPEDVKKDSKQKKRGRRKKSGTTSSENTKKNMEDCNANSHVMWTEKYKPQAADDFLSNLYSIEQLKKWLESWKHFNDEMLRKDKGGARKRKDSSSGDEFMDSESNDSCNGNLPNNTAILVGPHGCGKTAAVYAIANELGCKVLEINASSKRNGKRMLSELQEATQSHQVRAGRDHASEGILNSFFKGETTKSKKKKPELSQEITKPKQEVDESSVRKMSIILVEGVDIVYEDHDEGFVSALNTLVASSKRPVILITNVPHCSHLSRFMDMQLVLRFTAPLTRSMSVWLQLVCLLEGVRVSRIEIEKLLDSNRGDVRQTLLQLQFWVLSGGNYLLLNKEDCGSDLPEITASSGVQIDDEHSNLGWESSEETDDTPLRIPEHSSCLEIFSEYVEHKTNSLKIPFPSDLSFIWWNLASLLDIPESIYMSTIDKDNQTFCSDGIEHKDVSKEVLKERELEENAKDTVSQEDEVLEKLSGPNSIQTGKIKMACETQKEGTPSITSTKENEENKYNVTVNKIHALEKLDSGISLLETENNDIKASFIPQTVEGQSVKKSECSQLEADSFSQLLERMSVLDVISHRTDFSYASRREPCVRCWDQKPRDGTSLSETIDCQWWENSLTRDLCHRLLENSINRCRDQLQEARRCQEEMMSTRVTFTRPTQPELRWRSSQHAADNLLLPAVPLWYRSDHHSMSSDYFPMLRTVCRCEQDRLTSNTKRRNRFFHYLKSLNVHVNESNLRTFCTMFGRKLSS